MSELVSGVDNIVHARDVIKSLRSSSNANRNYKQNAVSDAFIVENLESFNNIVAERAITSSQTQQTEDLMKQSIAKFKPPVRYITSSNNSTNNGQIVFNPTTTPTKTTLTSSKYRDVDIFGFSSDEEDNRKKLSKSQNNSPNKLGAPGSPYDEATDDFDHIRNSSNYDDFDHDHDYGSDSNGEGDDDNDGDGGGGYHSGKVRKGSSKPPRRSQSKDLSPPQHNNNSITASTSSLKKATNASQNADLFGADDDDNDDEEDNRELFMNFTAPSSNIRQKSSNDNYRISAKNTHGVTTGNSSSSTSPVPGSVFTSSSTFKASNTSSGLGGSGGVYNSATGKTVSANSKNNKSGNGGNAGIRGIQDLLLSTNGSSSGGVKPASSAQLLKNVRPGQAIRVKPISKLRSNINADGGGALSIGNANKSTFG